MPQAQHILSFPAASVPRMANGFVSNRLRTFLFANKVFITQTPA